MGYSIRRYKTYLQLINEKKTTGSVLDVGCAEGGAYRFFKKNLKSFDYLGLDVKKPYDIYHDLNTNILPFDDKKFDVIIATEIFEHLSTPIKTLQEIRRSLRDDGIAIFSIPNEMHLLIRLKFLSGRPLVANGLFNFNDHLHFPSVSQINEFIEHEFKIEKQQYFYESYFTESPTIIHAWLIKHSELMGQFLAPIYPSLFSKYLIMRCTK